MDYPSVFSTVLLKMTIGSNQIISDTFVIASKIQTGIGFDCPDSLLFYWNKFPLANSYRVYKLIGRYMEPILMTADSFAVLQKNPTPSLHYAVAPVIAGKEGLRSDAINYTLQGVAVISGHFLLIS
jgi:hypothetical protein